MDETHRQKHPRLRLDPAAYKKLAEHRTLAQPMRWGAIISRKSRQLIILVFFQKAGK